MPREPIDVPVPLERLSILDENGEVDGELMPDLSEDLLRRVHRSMLRARRFDERLLTLQRQGRMGTFAPIKGQEACQVGAASVLREEDWFVPAFREMAAEMWRGKSMVSVLLTYDGFNEGGFIPEERNDLPICIPVASQLPHAVGIAYAQKLLGEDGIVMTSFGDGGTSEGDFSEAANFAAVFGVPAVFLCQNNHWAISVPLARQTRSSTLAQKAAAYGMPGIRVDGNDVFAVHVAAAEAAERARSGEGPSLIECVTYRMEVHTTADDPGKYREDEEVRKWAERDPIDRLQRHLESEGLVSAEDRETIEEEIEGEIEEAVAEWERRAGDLGDPLGMFEHAYAERPAYLERQRAELEAELADGEGSE